MVQFLTYAAATIVVMVLSLLVILPVWYLRRRRRIAAQDQIGQAALALAAEHDGFWDPDRLHAWVEAAAARVRRAQFTGEPDIIADIVTPAFLATLKTKRRQGPPGGYPAFVGEPRLETARIVGIEDYLDDTRDAASVYLETWVVQYVTDADGVKRSAKDITAMAAGDEPGTPEGAEIEQYIEELWHLRRVGDTWAIDAIDEEVSDQTLAGQAVFSEAAGLAAPAAQGGPEAASTGSRGLANLALWIVISAGVAHFAGPEDILALLIGLLAAAWNLLLLIGLAFMILVFPVMKIIEKIKSNKKDSGR